uniref:Receptor expression-enhancing protein n=1 Tax=Ascaris suum TaxID=6253 RepID=F1L8K7_ASCSU
MVFGFISHAATVAIGAVYPAFKTFKVIRDANTLQMMKWLRYWTVFSSFLAAEVVGDALLLPYIVPGYTLLKLGLLLWMVSPWTNGSEAIFYKVVAPMLATHEQDFDRMVSHIVSSGQNSIEGIWDHIADRARHCVMAIAWRGHMQPFEVRAMQPAIIRAIEEQDEVDVVANYNMGTRIELHRGDAASVNAVVASRMNGADMEYGARVVEDNDEPVAPRPRRRGRAKKTADAAEGRETVPRNRRVTAKRSHSRARRVDADLSE